MRTRDKRTRIAAVAMSSSGSLVVLSGRYYRGTVTGYQLDE